MSNKRGITLIALIVTIIVLLILAGVSIAVLTGENGILNRATEAKKTTEEAEVMEKIRLAFLNAQIGKYSGEHSPTDYATFASTMQAELVKTLGAGATVTTKGDGFEVSYGDMKFDVSSTGVVEKIEGISIGTSLTLQIIDGTKTPQNLSATLNGISGTVTWSKTAGTGDVSLISTTGNTISVTPESVGTATVTATCSGKTATCNVTIEEVNSITITFDANEGTFTNGTTTSVSGLPNATINLPTAPTRANYEFKGWYAATSGGNPVYVANATTGAVPASATNNAVTYYAQWKQPSQAFRSYGTYETAAAENGGMGAIGTRVFLVEGSTEASPKTIKVKGENAIVDNWRVFYEDKDFVYLIYGDYYQVDVQENTGLTSITFGGNKNYAVSDSTSRANLLKYLRNNSAYEWNSSTQTENHGTNGGTYESWNKLKTALK